MGSTYLKIDTEGSEWNVLERFLDSEADQDKIRTLDMEVHFGMAHAADRSLARRPEQETLESEVRVMERLLERFRVTGSTLEVYRQGWNPSGDCPKQKCREPRVHTLGGFSVEQFAISFVHRDLVR